MLKLFLTFGLRGDYNKVRKLALKSKLFYPLYKMFETFHCAFLPINNTIKGDISFPHAPYGCFFSTTCEIGRHCTIMQHVTIGSNFVNKSKFMGGGAPVIGDNVFIGAGAKIIGKVKIGNNVKIGAGCIVVTDVPDNAVVVMNKPRIIIKQAE